MRRLRRVLSVAWAVTHYEVLGVDPGASTDEIHRAYLAAARRHHPDRFAVEAWTGPTTACARSTRRGRSCPTTGGEPLRPDARDRRRSTVGPVADLDDTFVPYDDGESDEDDDDWRYEPDVGDPRTAPWRRVVLAPVVLGGLATPHAWWRGCCSTMTESVRSRRFLGVLT